MAIVIPTCEEKHATCLISVRVSTVVGWDVQQGKTGTQRRFQRPGQQQRSAGGHSVDRISVVLGSREDSELTQLDTKHDETAAENLADLQRHARSVEVQLCVPRDLISVPFLRSVPLLSGVPSHFEGWTYGISCERASVASRYAGGQLEGEDDVSSRVRPWTKRCGGSKGQRHGTHASGLGSDDGDERGDEGDESEAHLVGVVS